MVAGAGLEPARPLGARDFKSLVSTNSTTQPFFVLQVRLELTPFSSWVRGFKSRAFHRFATGALFEPMEGLEPPLDYTSLVYKTSAVATEPHRHIMEESLKSDFTEGLEPSKVCF